MADRPHVLLVPASLLALLLLGGCVSVKPPVAIPAQFGPKGAFLADVSHQIEDFKRHCAPLAQFTPQKSLLWNYADFLGDLLRDVNRQMGDGQTLTEEQLHSIALFAEVQTLASEDFVYPTRRGASGYEMAEARTIARRYEEVLRGLVPAMGRMLSAYAPAEKDWDDATVKAWLGHFDAAVGLDARLWQDPN